MKTKFAATAIVALMLGLPANAGGLVQPAPEPQVVPEAVPLYTPTADWSGGYIGAQLGYGDVTSTGGVLDGNGSIGGIHAGYRMDYGKFVGGAEISYDVANIDIGTFGDTLDNVARLKLIAGADLGKTLVYASVGAARANATIGGVDMSDNGFEFGVGADYALSDRWTVGGEVMAHRFNDFAGSGVDLDATTIQAKVAYRF
ncbi:MAG: porin family protein [Cypionkella sp.]|nr:porin family protein [Cypionkella sp.]